jgi:hypothetical protein
VDAAVRHDDRERRKLLLFGTSREEHFCDADRGIAALELEERVLNGLRDILLGNEALVDEFVAELNGNWPDCVRNAMGRIAAF